MEPLTLATTPVAPEVPPVTVSPISNDPLIPVRLSLRTLKFPKEILLENRVMGGTLSRKSGAGQLLQNVRK